MALKFSVINIKSILLGPVRPSLSISVVILKCSVVYFAPLVSGVPRLSRQEWSALPLIAPPQNWKYHFD
jgi:hypothetical protein